MRRHLLVFRTLKRRYALSRPRYSLRYWWYGGATFTMLLFTLLLVSSGLMYFYYMKCQIQSRELDKWRSGIKVPQQPVVTRVTKPKEENIPGMPAPGKVTSTEKTVASVPEPVKTPAPPPPEPETKATPKVAEVQDAPARTPDTKKIASAPEAKAQPTQAPTKRISSVYDAPPESANPGARPKSASPAIRVKVPPRATPLVTSDGVVCPRPGEDEIGAFLQQRSR
jgi:hypothetical protein